MFILSAKVLGLGCPIALTHSLTHFCPRNRRFGLILARTVLSMRSGLCLHAFTTQECLRLFSCASLTKYPLSLILGLSVLWLLGGCVTAPERIQTIPSDPTNPMKAVAILPMINNTNDVEAPNYIREELAKRMRALHYAVMLIEQTDQVLRDQMGITLGAQLDMTTAQEIGKTLGVDGVVYGALEDFVTKSAIMMQEKRVRARFALLKTTDGTRFWGNGAGVISRSMYGRTAVGSGLEAASRREAAVESKGERRKLTGSGTAGTAKELPGGLEEIPAPWTELPVDVVETKKGDLLESAIGGVVQATVGRALERVFGVEYAAEVDLMFKLIIEKAQRGERSHAELLDQYMVSQAAQHKATGGVCESPPVSKANVNIIRTFYLASGMSPEQVEKLMAQVEPLSQERQGECKEIVKSSEGKAESAPSLGAVPGLRLPIGPVP